MLHFTARVLRVLGNHVGCMDTIEFYSIYSFTGLFMGLITSLTAVYQVAEMDF